MRPLSAAERIYGAEGEKRTQLTKSQCSGRSSRRNPCCADHTFVAWRR